MAKRANDLLDVFRLGPAEDEAPRPRSRGSSSRKRSAASSDGVFLAKRQVLLLGATGVLLVVLAFTAGLGYGRKRGGGPALNKATPTANYWIRGRLRSTDPLSGEPVPREAVIREIQARYGIPETYIRVRDEDEQRLAIDLGPFSSKAAAKQYFMRKRVDMLQLPWGHPFFRATFEPGPR
jgi:hypothetical protein